MGIEREVGWTKVLCLRLVQIDAGAIMCLERPTLASDRLVALPCLWLAYSAIVHSYMTLVAIAIALNN